MVLGNLACTTHGAAMVVPAPAFEPAATLQTAQDERCTSLYGVPTMFIAELALDDARRVLRDEIGVDPGPDLRALEAAILEHGHPLYRGRLTPRSFRRSMWPV